MKTERMKYEAPVLRSLNIVLSDDLLAASSVYSTDASTSAAGIAAYGIGASGIEDSPEIQIQGW